jgi:hypothetical protein
MNQAFGVNNTTKDITHSGPVAQKLALHKGATLFADTTVVGDLCTPISIETLKQAAMGSTIIIDFFDTAGGNAQIYTLNKSPGAPRGSVSAVLIDQLNLKRVGDCALLHFFCCQTLTNGGVQIQSDDLSIQPPPQCLTLFDGTTFTKKRGEAVAEIRALNVTPGAESVFWFNSDFNAFL